MKFKTTKINSCVAFYSENSYWTSPQYKLAISSHRNLISRTKSYCRFFIILLEKSSFYMNLFPNKSRLMRCKNGNSFAFYFSNENIDFMPKINKIQFRLTIGHMKKFCWIVYFLHITISQRKKKRKKSTTANVMQIKKITWNCRFSVVVIARIYI